MLKNGNCYIEFPSRHELKFIDPKTITVHRRTDGVVIGYSQDIDFKKIALWGTTGEPSTDTQFKKFAPLKRNMDMLNLGDVELVVACYDGRDHGGTLFTMQYAYKCNIEVLIVEAIGGT